MTLARPYPSTGQRQPTVQTTDHYYSATTRWLITMRRLWMDRLTERAAWQRTITRQSAGGGTRLPPAHLHPPRSTHHQKQCPLVGTDSTRTRANEAGAAAQTCTTVLYLNATDVHYSTLPERHRRALQYSTWTPQTCTTVLYLNATDVHYSTLPERHRRALQYSTWTPQTCTTVLYLNATDVHYSTLPERHRRALQYSTWTPQTCTTVLYLNATDVHYSTLPERYRRALQYSTWTPQTCTTVLYLNATDVHYSTLPERRRLPIFRLDCQLWNGASLRNRHLFKIKLIVC